MADEAGMPPFDVTQVEDPWGLEITLSQDVLEKVGVDYRGLTLGQKINVEGIAVLCHMALYGEEPTIRLRFQTLELESPEEDEAEGGKEKPNPGSRLYGAYNG